MRNPEWTDPRTGEYYHPDAPDNPLGEHWIGLEGQSGPARGQTSYGIHGTIEPKSIGSDMSRGCVRMHNRDVAEVFDMLVVRASRVTIQD